MIIKRLVRSHPKVVVLVMATIAFPIVRSGFDDTSEANIQSSRKWKNRLWVNRMPENSRDMVNHLAFIEMDNGRFGTFAHASVWRGRLENFVWKRDGNKVDLFLPQERRRAKIKLRPHKCGDNTPKGFDLCMTVQSGNRATEFYSHHDWIIRPHRSNLSSESLPPALNSPALAFLDAFRQSSNQSEDASIITPSIDLNSALSWPSTELDFRFTPYR